MSTLLESIRIQEPDMNFDNIPLEMRARPQWVVWKSIVRNGQIAKPPYNPRYIHYPAEIDEPGTWASFEEAYFAWANNSEVLSGIGYVFTKDDPFFGIDIDDEAKVKPQNVETRRAIVSRILNEVRTYTEISPSGKGLHIIGRGKMPFDGKRSIALELEMYDNKRFFTITGNVFDGRNQLADHQQFVDDFTAAILVDESNKGVGDNQVNRRTDLTDEEVIRLATNFSSTFAPRFNAQIGCEPGEWSETFIAIVGLLDMFTGSVDQIERIVMTSPMVLSAPPSTSGEARIHKAHRNLHTTLRRVRGNNNGTLYHIEFGRKLIANMEEAAKGRAAETADRIRGAEKAITSGKILDAFPMLQLEHRELKRPPGIVGEFVEATEMACFMPFTKFAIPATLAALAGIVARGYKLQKTMGGINVNFILAAPSSTGKTQNLTAWQTFCSEAAACIQNNLQSPSRSRVLEASAASIQGIFEDFMHVPSLCWMIDECAAQLRIMANATSPTEIALRDAYNKLFDASKHGKFFQPPKSVSGKKAEWKAIENLNVSTFWMTTDSKFDVNDNDALDGFLSRVTVIRHTGEAGERQRYPQHSLDNRLNDMLVHLLGNAKRLDETYEYNSNEAAKLLTVVSTEGIEDLKWEILLIVDKIKNASLSGELPKGYTSLSRLPILAERIAAVMAVLENPYTPAITADQYLWAFGYTLQNTLALLEEMDSGEIGDKAASDVLVVVRLIKTYLKKHPRENSMPKNDLRRMLIGVKPFSEAPKGTSASRLVRECLAGMVTDGLLVELTEQPGLNTRPGRPRLFVAPTDDTIWN